MHTSDLVLQWVVTHHHCYAGLCMVFKQNVKCQCTPQPHGRWGGEGRRGERAPKCLGLVCSHTVGQCFGNYLFCFAGGFI